MVRLKDTLRELESAAEAFQFLMVRLKDPADIHHDRQPDISIPYGSIKSSSISLTSITMSTISIPYGSIKSLAQLYDVN